MRILVLASPRSGSTFFSSLLKSNPDIGYLGELLNDENNFDDPIEYVQQSFTQAPLKKILVFKVFPEQLLSIDLPFDELCGKLDIQAVIVVWRENFLEQYVSRLISEKTNIWYATETPMLQETVTINIDKLNQYRHDFEKGWKFICETWPLRIKPIFVKYEDVITDKERILKNVCYQLSCPNNFPEFKIFSAKQNPDSLEKKVTNYFQLPDKVKSIQFDVSDYITKYLSERLKKLLPKTTDILKLIPDHEPLRPPDGWIYKVSEPLITNTMKSNVIEAIYSGQISSASHWLGLFETNLKTFFNCSTAQPCSNGFTSLVLALQAIKIQSGDEVIIPSFTMIAVANAVAFLQAIPVFADCANDEYNPSWQEISPLVTAKTKAIIVTHTYGVPCHDIASIVNECKGRNIVLIEDISECFGIQIKLDDGNEKLLGTFGDLACGSLYANKLIHSGDGGFVISKHWCYSERLRSLVNHGFTSGYHFLHFEKAINAKMNGICAALASACLNEVDNILEHRRQLASEYRMKLHKLPLKLMKKCGKNDTPWVFSFECISKEERAKLRAYLANHGIETRDFFFPLHLQPAFREFFQGRLSVSEKLATSGFYLPTHPNLTISDVSYISSLIRNFFNVETNGLKCNPPSKSVYQDIIIEPGTYEAKVMTLSNNKIMKKAQYRTFDLGDVLTNKIILDKCLKSENCDAITECIEFAEKAIADHGGIYKENLIKAFMPFIEYFKSKACFVPPCTRPWIREMLPDLQKEIPTTTDKETLQLIIWLIKIFKPKKLLELGCWLGYCSILMAKIASTLNSDCEIYACDGFQWQSWMEKFSLEQFFQYERNFLKTYKNYINGYVNIIKPVTWCFDNEKLPHSLQSKKLEFVYIDFTQEAEELENVWQKISPLLIINKTIIVMNGLSITSIPFFTKHQHELRPIAKPLTIAKAFLYCDDSYDVFQLTKQLYMETGYLEWEHHHNDAFLKPIGILKEKVHCESANILFLPGVEEAITSCEELLQKQPWVGIIHQPINNPEQYYVPDLNRLCHESKYLPYFAECRGLFTLTNIQKRYLEEHLKVESKFPIQQIFYPFEQVNGEPSQLLAKLKSEVVDVIFIGNFARDYNLFYDAVFPSGFRKVLLVGEKGVEKTLTNVPSDIIIQSRLEAADYEKALRSSIVFLALKYDGIANTVIMECISRSVPILVPALESCIEYIGKDYPLLYDMSMKNFIEKLSHKNIENAMNYLMNMDKTRFSMDYFTRSILDGVVFKSMPLSVNAKKGFPDKSLTSFYCNFDLTISICSYKRTHNLKKILDSLMNKQNYDGRVQIIIWNNNRSLAGTVNGICKPFIALNNKRMCVELINSTENYVCAIRFAMPALMRSNCLLTCDDDIVPNSNFISFFMKNKGKHPNDILCVRGHTFKPHELNTENPSRVWCEYDNLKFIPDAADEQFVHFVHADTCLIPKQALIECSTITMPDSQYALVDDYWMSFVLNHKFSRKLRKLCVEEDQTPFHRTEDSDTPGLALHTSREVRDARVRLYIHHMLQGWPQWKPEYFSKDLKKCSEIEKRSLSEFKSNFWKKNYIGFNIGINIKDKKINDLFKLGVKCVRLGAVGAGEKNNYVFSEFLDDKVEAMRKLYELISKLKTFDISVVISLDKRIVSPKLWRYIAENCASLSNVVGYDLINEPISPLDLQRHWKELDESYDQGVHDVVKTYIAIIKELREVDDITPIIIEPTFWGSIHSLRRFPIENITAIESNLILSIHFYETRILTCRLFNKGEFTYPGFVPVYRKHNLKDKILVDNERLKTLLEGARHWSDSHGVRLCIGEFGISREIKGAPEYLESVIKICFDNEMIGFIYAFAEEEWDSMNYELGPSLTTNEKDLPYIDNPLMTVISNGITRSANINNE